RRRHPRHLGGVRRVPRPALLGGLARAPFRLARPGRAHARRRHAPDRPLLVKLVLVGTSHHLAPLELRERVAFPRDAAAALARELAESGLECVCLSTCNRTELYLATDDPDAAEAAAEARLEAVGGALYRP